MKFVHIVAFLLLAVGGLNWLLVALMGQDVGTLALGGMSSAPARLLYLLVGVSAVYELVTHKGRCKECVPQTKV